MQIKESISGKRGFHAMLHVCRFMTGTGYKAAESFVYLKYSEWRALRSACHIAANRVA